MNLQFVAAVAAALGPDWCVVQVPNEEMRETNVRLILANDEGELQLELSLSIGCPSGSSEKRFFVCPNWPRTSREYYRPYRDAVGEITVSAKAAPERLAGEITRRLLPVYREQHAEAVARLRGDLAAWAERDAIAAKIAATWGGASVRAFPNGRPAEDPEVRIRFPFDRPDVDVIARPYAGAKFTIDIESAEEAGELAAWLFARGRARS